MMDGATNHSIGTSVLMVDDTPANLRVLAAMLKGQGYKVRPFPNGRLALGAAENDPPDLILLDIMMPEMDGYEVCRRLKEHEHLKDIPVIFLSAKGETGDIIQGFTLGAVDYIIKPFREEEVLARVRTHMEKAWLTRELMDKNRELEEEIARRRAISIERNHLAERLSMISQSEAERWGIPGFVGRSHTMQQVLQEIDLLHQTPTMSVLITGESGTGKELIARAIHFGGPRTDGPFVPVNCSAIPSDLAESLLFGHVRGAFTGADKDRTGYFELADGGTLFLDEIGDMPLDLQPKLLRVLEDGRILRVGGREEKVVEVRVVAATNADLQDRISAGAFRQDLYYRLARFMVQIPPLREHKEDIPLLAEHFLLLFAREMNLEPPGLSTSALACLERYDFPGNVRELKNVIERALIQSRGDDIQPEHLQFTQTASAPAQPPPTTVFGADMSEVPLNLERALELAESLVIQRALKQTDGNVAAAARLLDTNRPRIYRALSKEEQRPPTE